MSQLEYLIALVSIIVALAIADLAGSFRELVRPRRAVRWHWLPVTWAAIVLMLLVQFWWVSFSILQGAVFGQALAFLPYLLAFLMLYLACAFALPDPECRPECAPEKQPDREGPDDNSPLPESTLNMKAFYFSTTHRRWFFGALIALVVLGQGLLIMSSLSAGNATGYDVVLTATANLTGAGLLGALIITERRWIHTAVTVLMVVTTTYTFASGLPAIS